jgi:hypothetical protein
MRTTLNLDEDVSAQLTALAARRDSSLSRVANDLIRTGLRAANSHQAIKGFLVRPRDTGRPLIDVTDVAAALEVLDRAD